MASQTMKVVEQITISSAILLASIAAANIIRGVGIDDPGVESVTWPLVGVGLVILAYLALTVRVNR